MLGKGSRCRSGRLVQGEVRALKPCVGRGVRFDGRWYQKGEWATSVADMGPESFVVFKAVG